MSGKTGLSAIQGDANIVIRCANWVGDLVMGLPALKELARILRPARLTLWVPESLKPLAELASVSHDIIAFGGDLGGPVKRSLRMRRCIAERDFDAAIFLQNAFEGAFTAWLAGIPLRIGYPTDLRGPLLTHRAPLDPEIKKKHQVYYYLAISDYIDELVHGRRNHTGTPDCSVEIPAHMLNAGRDLLRSEGITPDSRFLCLCPGSVNSEAKRWPADYFAHLGDMLSDLGRVVFLGAPNERKLISDIINLMKSPAANLAGKADIGTSLSVMRQSQLVISNDTGSAHMAVAASSPVLTIFGPTIPGATAPFGEKTYIIKGEADCAPCRHFKCPIPEHPCMASITPEIVYSKVMRILNELH